MLLTSGDVPVAHEFSSATRPGRLGSEFSPVKPECPIAMTPTGLPGLAAVAVDVVSGPAAADVVAGPVAAWSAMCALPHPLTAKAQAMMAATAPVDLVFMCAPG